MISHFGKMNISRLCLDYTLAAWKKAGSNNRMTIAEELVRLMEEHFSINNEISEKTKIELITRGVGRLGWNLNTLAKMGYGYNTAGDKHKEDNAGKLNEVNKRGMWVLYKEASEQACENYCDNAEISLLDYESGEAFW